MKRLFSLMIIPLIFLYTQAGNGQSVDSVQNGIHFERRLNWQQILAKAKEENKYIFLDFYTTWCGPCKMMEKNIYPLKEVGDFFNRHFISVTVQLDRTNNDNDIIKAWYTDAKKIEKLYSIDAYPTFLFLSPEGKPLHRAAGAFEVKKFLEIAADALDPEKQSYTLSARYNAETMDTAEMKKMARHFRFTSPELAENLAVEYLKRIPAEQLSNDDNLALLKEFSTKSAIRKIALNYINRLTETQLTKENINTIIQFLSSSRDSAFRLLYQHSGKIDQIMNGSSFKKYWFAQKWIDRIIYTEEIEPKLDNARKENAVPDWNNISASIKGKYNNDYATRNIITAKINWHLKQKNFQEYTKHVVKYLEKYGSYLEYDWGWNNYAWEIFLYSNSKEELNRALKWSERAVLMNPTAEWMDTYANILFKLNRKEEAILWEEVAANLDPEHQNTLKKLKSGQPTWRVPDGYQLMK